VPGGAEPVGLLRRSGAKRSELAEQLMDILRNTDTDAGDAAH
jgi:hypothetical protein